MVRIMPFKIMLSRLNNHAYNYVEHIYNSCVLLSFSFCICILCSIYWASLFAFLLGERTMFTQWMQVCRLIIILYVMSQTSY